jgi:predicted nucleotidyltransferase
MRDLILRMEIDDERMMSSADMANATLAAATHVYRGAFEGDILDAHGERIGRYELTDETLELAWEEDPANEDRIRLTNDELIEEVASRLTDAAPGAKVILFGSRSRGTHRVNSDVGLFVIEPDKVTKPRAEYARLRRTLRGLGVSLDLVVIDRHYAENRGGWTGSALNQALTGGRVLVDPPLSHGTVTR